MPHYTYLIIGGGMTADAAAQAIREIDPIGSIGMFSRELYAPYNRPPLTKALWKGDSLETIWRGTDKKNISLLLNTNIVSLNTTLKQIKDSAGITHTYDKLLLATGGVPRRLPFGGDSILYYRTLDDYNFLRSITITKDRFAVIGGGFIGSEIAAALTMNGKKVTEIFPESGIGARVFPSDMALFLNDFYRAKGVEIFPEETVTDVVRANGESNIHTKSGKKFAADCVIAGIGIIPDTTLAESTGITCNNGIIVDEFCKTSATDVYAAGDVANFYSNALDKRIRVEHEDNANTMGIIAGRAMAGMPEPYTHIPMFYSDLFELGYEAAGEIDSRLETFADWKEPFREGVVYYLQNGRVRGVLLVNTWGQVDNARKMINKKGSFMKENLKGKII